MTENISNNLFCKENLDEQSDKGPLEWTLSSILLQNTLYDNNICGFVTLQREAGGTESINVYEYKKENNFQNEVKQNSDSNNKNSKHKPTIYLKTCDISSFFEMDEAEFRNVRDIHDILYNNYIDIVTPADSLYACLFTSFIIKDIINNDQMHHQDNYGKETGSEKKYVNNKNAEESACIKRTEYHNCKKRLNVFCDNISYCAGTNKKYTTGLFSKNILNEMISKLTYKKYQLASKILTKLDNRTKKNPMTTKQEKIVNSCVDSIQQNYKNCKKLISQELLSYSEDHKDMVISVESTITQITKMVLEFKAWEIARDKARKELEQTQRALSLKNVELFRMNSELNNLRNSLAQQEKYTRNQNQEHGVNFEKEKKLERKITPNQYIIEKTTNKATEKPPISYNRRTTRIKRGAENFVVVDYGVL